MEEVEFDCDDTVRDRHGSFTRTPKKSSALPVLTKARTKHLKRSLFKLTEIARRP